MRGVLRSRHSVALVLSLLVGAGLYFRYPVRAENLYLQLIALRSPVAYEVLTRGYTLLVFTTPFVLFSALLAAVYVHASRDTGRVEAGPLPAYPLPKLRERLFLVLAEVHHPTETKPSPRPRWLAQEERGLYASIAILGELGSGKTRGAIRPYARQLFSYRAQEASQRLGGLVLEVKGDLCHAVREDLVAAGREADYLEIALEGKWAHNPLYNDLDAYSQAYGVASLMNNLFGRGKDPFWQQAYTNLVKFVLLLDRLLYDYTTLFDVYYSCINTDLLQEKLQEGERRFHCRTLVVVEPEVLDDPTKAKRLVDFGFAYDQATDTYRAEYSRRLEAALTTGPQPIRFTTAGEEGGPALDSLKRQQFEAVKRWFNHDWSRIDSRLRTSVVEGISVFLSLFDENPQVKRIFCPPKEAYAAGDDGAAGTHPRAMRPFSELIERGAVVGVNLPAALNPGLSRAIGTLMKLDFQRATLLRIPQMAKDPRRYFRPVVFLCDEYHAFATCGENDPTGDEKWLALSRQARVIPIVATQSVSSLKTALPGDTYRTLLQCFGTILFLRTKDELTAKLASELCGKDDKSFVTYNLSESASDARVSLLSGRAVSNKGTLTASKNYSLRLLPRFPEKTFTQLQDCQAVVIGYDGRAPIEPTLCYLKPHDLNPNLTWFDQRRRGLL